MEGIRISLHGPLAFAAILVIAGVWGNNDILTYLGAFLGLLISVIELAIKIDQYDRYSRYH